MEVVIDSNLLFRILISAGEITQLVFNDELEITAPKALKDEFDRHREEILSKCKSKRGFEEMAELVFDRIKLIEAKRYAEFLHKARDMLEGHNKDEDFLALALYKGCKLWTYESRFFRLGYAISTKELAALLSSK